jgi:predicted glycosyl hydrolase (DUF1957 family)
MVRSTSCVLAVMLQVLQNYQGTLRVWSPYTTACYMHVNHIINRCFNWRIKPAQRTFLQSSVLNKYVRHLLHCLEYSWTVLSP